MSDPIAHAESHARTGLNCHDAKCPHNDYLEPDATVNGWTYDPAEQAWALKVPNSPARWIVLHDSYEHAPSAEFTRNLLALLVKEGS